MRPRVLPPNLLRHFYRGGARIGRLRGVDVESEHMPEEWLGAVNSAFGSDERGLGRLQDGTLVRDAIAADPEGWLGAEHVQRFGQNPGLLVKLLDAGQRLPVHFHPGRGFAREALGLPYGKTEAWLIIEAEPGASVHAGFSRTVELPEVREWMRTQDSAAMLGAMHELEVAAGDAIFIPAGTPHAIGAGILLLELQEPTDLSVLLEWNGFELSEDDGHLNLGWDRVLQALDRTAWSAERVGELRGPDDGARRLPAAADPYFRAERVAGGDSLDAGFSVLVGLEGNGSLLSGGDEMPFGRGSAVLVPYASGGFELRGRVEALRARPADPNAGEGQW
jgi:mannose-6-phosphate isomerase